MIVLNPALKEVELLDYGYQKYLFYREDFSKDQIVKMTIIRPMKRLMLEEKSIYLLFRGDNFPEGMISTLGFLPGEKVILNFKSEDGEFDEQMEFIPNSLHATSTKNKFSIDLELRSVNPTSFIIHFKGIKEGEKLTMVSNSYSETLNHEFIYQERISYMPGVIGKKGGTAKLSFTTPSGACVSLDVPWGSELLKV